MPGSTGTGCPHTLRCAKCKVGIDHHSHLQVSNRGTRLEATGCTKPLAASQFGHNASGRMLNFRAQHEQTYSIVRLLVLRCSAAAVSELDYLVCKPTQALSSIPTPLAQLAQSQDHMSRYTREKSPAASTRCVPNGNRGPHS